MASDWIWKATNISTYFTGCDALSRGGGLTAGYKPRSNCCSSSHGKMIRRAMKYQPIGLTGCDTATAEGWKESCGTTVSISSTLPLCYSLCEMPSMTQLPTARIVPAKLHTAGEEGVYAELLNNQGILDSSECLELARLAKRKGAWCVAEAALCPLAARRDPAAMLQLAKLCEHQLGDIERALELTLSLAALRLPPSIHIRLERLESKRAQRLAV